MVNHRIVITVAMSLLFPACILVWLRTANLDVAPASTYLPISSPALRPYSAMYAAPIAKYGFTPFPKTADVRIEKVSGSEVATDGYDAMLQIFDRSGKRAAIETDVAFRLVKKKYQWVGQSESWVGPHKFKDANGDVTNEMINISYYTVAGSGLGKPNVLSINYFGDNPVLSAKQVTESLKLKDVRPIIKKWCAP